MHIFQLISKLLSNTHWTVLLITFGVIAVIFSIVYLILKKVGKNPKYLLPINFANRFRVPLLLFLLGTFMKLHFLKQMLEVTYQTIASHIGTFLLIISSTWFVLILLQVFKDKVVARYDRSASDNLRARKIYTQFNILERIITFLIVIFAIGIALMSIDEIRNIGISMLTSAGVAGIIIGFSAQKALGTLLAGIQIAFTQPIRIDDVVIVEGEWGTIEEITLTYVVIKIWDRRRLIVPTTYFIEKPFQNWTRNSSDILGTVFIHTDYLMNVESLRSALTTILKSTPLWDQEVNVLQVTDAKSTAVEIRALMSAKDSPTAWDLRVHVREELLKHLQQNHPESLTRTRISIEQRESVPN